MPRNVFNFFGSDFSGADDYANASKPKPKSHSLPCFCAVNHFTGGGQTLLASGDCLAEAFECFGGMSVLYSLKDDPENTQAFKDLYKKEVLFLSFGDEDYGFNIYKESAAIEFLDGETDLRS